MFEQINFNTLTYEHFQALNQRRGSTIPDQKIT